MKRTASRIPNILTSGRGSVSACTNLGLVLAPCSAFCYPRPPFSSKRRRAWDERLKILRSYLWVVVSDFVSSAGRTPAPVLGRRWHFSTWLTLPSLTSREGTLMLFTRKDVPSPSALCSVRVQLLVVTLHSETMTYVGQSSQLPTLVFLQTHREVWTKLCPGLVLPWCCHGRVVLPGPAGSQERGDDGCRGQRRF